MGERMLRWEETARRAGLPEPAAGAVGRALLARWGETHRAYHDQRHLDEVLDRVDALSGEASRPDLVRLAAWFHDAVYDVHAADSEERSARLAARELSVLGPAAAEVARLVRLTATHHPSPDDADGQVLVDADLGILAADRARYDEYAADVRREYAHVPTPLFAAARTRVLRGLVAAPRLFRTRGAQAWESAARANVARELSALAAAAAAPRPAGGGSARGR